ncbi:MAG: glycosyltransferase family 4 protein [Chloroflexi bacterium]|nr:glycosyltransferase family 4 protein [Chloroflexota bacterium]
MRIALIDYHLNTTNAIGHGFHRIAEALKDEHQFTVFAASFDNPDPAKIEYVHVPALHRPLFLLFLSFHVTALLTVWWYQLRNRVRFDVVHSSEVNVFNRGIVYPQFCNTAYLRNQWKTSRPSGIYGLIRWLDHQLRALAEPLVFRFARRIVAPSDGLAREITTIFGQKVGSKVRVIHNPVDIEKMKQPDDFDREGKRRSQGFTPDDLVLSFVALGHFERKGLPLLFAGIQAADNPRLKLMIVGGTPYLIESYKQRAKDLGIQDQVVFVGTHADIRPFLWMSDLFAFPSAYETFSLVTIEACAAGIPVLVSQLYGVEDYLVDGFNGWQVERTPEALAEKLRFAFENRALLPQIGQNAANSVKGYDGENFVENWRTFYTRYVAEFSSPSGVGTPSQLQAK